jgi:hypothetical protein
MRKYISAIAVLLLISVLGSAIDAKPQRHAKQHALHTRSYAYSSGQPQSPGLSSHDADGLAFGSARWWDGKQGQGGGGGGGGGGGSGM